MQLFFSVFKGCLVLGYLVYFLWYYECSLGITWQSFPCDTTRHGTYDHTGSTLKHHSEKFTPWIPSPLRKWNPRFDRRNGCSNNVAKTGIHESLWLVETFAQKYNNLAANCNKQSDHGSTLLPGSSLYLKRGPWERGCSRLSVGSTASARDFLFDSRVSLIRCFPLETEPRVFRLLHHTT